MIWTKPIPYFSREELADKSSGALLLDARFAAALPFLRAQWSMPLYPTSVCRTPSHNADVGGHPRSMHLTENPVHPTDGTMAADIYWMMWKPKMQLELARLAWELDWSVGLHPSFVHLDRRHDIGLRKRVFLYDEWNRFNPQEVM